MDRSRYCVELPATSVLVSSRPTSSKRRHFLEPQANGSFIGGLKAKGAAFSGSPPVVTRHAMRG